MRHGRRRETQNTFKCGAITIDQGGVLTDASELGMRQVEERWYMLTKA